MKALESVALLCGTGIFAVYRKVNCRYFSFQFFNLIPLRVKGLLDNSLYETLLPGIIGSKLYS